MAKQDALRVVAYAVHIALLLACMPLPAQNAKPVRVMPGTEVQLVLEEPLSSQTAIKGQKFSLTVAQDVRVQGQVVIPKGSHASGLVVRAEPNGTFGKPGTLQLRIQSLMLEGRRIPLFYSSLVQGKERDGSAVVLTALFGPVGMMKRGIVVTVPAGTRLLAYIDEAFDTSGASPGDMATADSPAPPAVEEPPPPARSDPTPNPDGNDE